MYRVAIQIKLSKKCAEYVQNKWGISVYSEEISEIDWKGEMFDYIGFFQVLEHIENPKLFLNNIPERRMFRGYSCFASIHGQ